ncbi:DUF512 domain-containing protein [Lutibacter sp. B2]|nr:DUF512 domain-containing protein [Lutibacter sp. B2]
MLEQQIKNVILEVDEKGKAKRVGIEPGDQLLRINGQMIEDIIEYMFLISDEEIEIEIEKKDGEVKKFKIYKEFDEDLGIVFENPIIDQAKSCKNKCVFCFIDQLPPNMRGTLYFKDDDSRLSFLQGNFITLTNMSDHDIDKIIRYRISPINVSIHTTEPETRVKMLNNKTAGNIYNRLKRLAEAGIQINGQIVLCPGLNDKEKLDQTIKHLADLYPSVYSMAIVPVGVTKFRNNLYPLRTFDHNMSCEVIHQVEKWQNKFISELGTRFVHLSDEFYVLADKELPNYEEYEGFPLIENGVGLMTKLEYEFEHYLESIKDDLEINKKVSIATGKSAKKFIDGLCEKLHKKFNNIQVNVYEIRNDFFGETISVTGLVTATDIINQLKGKSLGEKLIFSESMLKSGESIFLDDLSIKDLEKELDVKSYAVKNDGQDFINKIIR